MPRKASKPNPPLGSQYHSAVYMNSTVHARSFEGTSTEKAFAEDVHRTKHVHAVQYAVQYVLQHAQGGVAAHTSVEEGL